MARAVRAHRVRHRRLLERGLSRGEIGRPRLRHLDAWAERLAHSLPADGGLLGTETDSNITGVVPEDNKLTLNAHGFRTGEEVNFFGGTTDPGGLTTATKADATLTFVNVTTNGNTVTINDTVYTWRTTPTHTHANEVAIGANAAACVTNLRAALRGDNTGNVRGSTTFSGTSQPANTNTIVITGATTFVFQASSNDVTRFEGATIDVLIGSSAAVTFQNLANAINGIGQYTPNQFFAATYTSGSTSLSLTAVNPGASGNFPVTQSPGFGWLTPGFTGGAETHSEVTPEHDAVDVRSFTATTLVVEAKRPGTIGNAIPVAEASTATSWSGTTLANGAGLIYYAIEVDANNFALARDREAAYANQEIDITSFGTGTFQVARILDRDSIVNMLYTTLSAEQINGFTDIDDAAA